MCLLSSMDEFHLVLVTWIYWLTSLFLNISHGHFGVTQFSYFPPWKWASLSASSMNSDTRTTFGFSAVPLSFLCIFLTPSWSIATDTSTLSAFAMFEKYSKEYKIPSCYKLFFLIASTLSLILLNFFCSYKRSYLILGVALNFGSFDNFLPKFYSLVLHMRMHV